MPLLKGHHSEYNRWPDKSGPSRRHFGRAVYRSILCVIIAFSIIPLKSQKYNNMTFTIALPDYHVQTHDLSVENLHSLSNLFRLTDKTKMLSYGLISLINI